MRQRAARSAIPRRGDSRLPQILDAAAALFAERGFQAASVRDIVRTVGMLPGSLYCHFANKEQLLVAVYGEGVRRIGEAVDAAVAREQEPWARLEAAATAHLECLLDRSAYAKVVVSVQPADVPAAEDELVALRDAYEHRFRDLMAALPLPPRTRRGTLRMLLLGALNWTPTWYREGGSNPRRIAQDFVQLLRSDLSPSGLRPAAGRG